MIYLGEALAGRKAVAFCGALSKDLLPLTISGEAASGEQVSFHLSPLGGVKWDSSRTKKPPHA